MTLDPLQQKGKMAYPANLANLYRLAGRGRVAVSISALLLSMLFLGCSAQFVETSESERVASQVQSRPAIVEATTPSIKVFESHPLQPVAYDDPVLPAPKEDTKKNDKNESDEPKDKGEAKPPKQKITLPMAIELCVKTNFRVLAEAQKIHMAEGDLITSALIPNPSLFSDCQLVPLQRADIQNQLGPPQWDTLVTFPIDWLLFGKRVAAMQAARLGIEVNSASFANVLRAQLARTVDVFYEVLMDKAYFELAEKNLEELTDLEKLTKQMAKAKKVSDIELDRVKLAVHEALLERHDRELALEIAKAKFRPFIGRTAADEDYEIEGVLTVKAMVPPPKLKEAVALAEVHRPDLLSGRKAIDQTNAVVEFERRRGKPVVAIQPGWTYQDQRHITGFRNGSMFDIGISTTLPVTDRNQGNIRKAQAAVEERRFSYLGDRADALAEVEASLANYADAVEHLTEFNTPETLKSAYDLRTNIESAYRAGNRKLIELLDAQRAYQSRLAHVIEFESFYWRSLNNLNAAVGLKAYDHEKAATQTIGKEEDKKK